MDNVQTLKKEEKFWMVVTGSDGLPVAYEAGDYMLTEDRFLYIWNNKGDERPRAIINLTLGGSVDFSDEPPEIMSLEEWQEKYNLEEEIEVEPNEV